MMVFSVRVMLTLCILINILNNYFMDILATDAVSFALNYRLLANHPHLQGIRHGYASFVCSSTNLIIQVYRQLFLSACYNAMHHKSCYIETSNQNCGIYCRYKTNALSSNCVYMYFLHHMQFSYHGCINWFKCKLSHHPWNTVHLRSKIECTPSEDILRTHLKVCFLTL
jgi:hypothetical protein